jgi:hypothetical protein
MVRANIQIVGFCFEKRKKEKKTNDSTLGDSTCVALAASLFSSADANVRNSNTSSYELRATSRIRFYLLLNKNERNETKICVWAQDPSIDGDDFRTVRKEQQQQ